MNHILEDSLLDSVRETWWEGTKNTVGSTPSKVFEIKKGIIYRVLVVVVVGPLLFGRFPLFSIAMFQCNLVQIADGCNFEELAFYINIVSILLMTVASTADPNKNVCIVHLPCHTLVAFFTISQDKEKWDKKSDNFDSIPNTMRKIRYPIFLDI